MKWMHNRKNLRNSDGFVEEGDFRIDREIKDQQNNNVIYFYKIVDPNSVVDLSQKIDTISSQMEMAKITFNLMNPPPIHLHIHTEGGDLMSALAISDKIANSRVPIYTYCEGIVASAGTLLSVAGTKRFITKNSCMLIHQLQGELWGNYEKLKDEAENVNLLMGFIRRIYTEHTKMENELIDEILKHDLYMSADVCLSRGLVDEII